MQVTEFVSGNSLGSNKLVFLYWFISAIAWMNCI